MQLDDMPWRETDGHMFDKYADVNPDIRVIHCRTALYIIIAYGKERGSWYDLDPITAQAVLYHLTIGGN